MSKQLKYNVLLMIVTAMLPAGKPTVAFAQHIPEPIDTGFVTFLNLSLSNPGDSILFNGVWYACVGDKDVTDPELYFGGWPQVRAMAYYAMQHKDFQFHLDSYTTAEGNDNYNLKLSQRRSDMFNKVFAKWGLSPKNLTAYGRGESSNPDHFRYSTTIVFKRLPNN